MNKNLCISETRVPAQTCVIDRLPSVRNPLNHAGICETIWRRLCKRPMQLTTWKPHVRTKSLINKFYNVSQPHYIRPIRRMKTFLNQSSDMKIIQTLYLLIFFHVLKQRFNKTYVQHFDNVFLQELCIQIKVDMQRWHWHYLIFDK